MWVCQWGQILLANDSYTYSIPESNQKGPACLVTGVEFRQNLTNVKKTLAPSTSTKHNLSALPSTVDFSIYHFSDLKEMLHKIGMDTRGLTKEELIIFCNTHSNISTPV